MPDTQNEGVAREIEGRDEQARGREGEREGGGRGDERVPDTKMSERRHLLHLLAQHLMHVHPYSLNPIIFT